MPAGACVVQTASGVLEIGVDAQLEAFRRAVERSGIADAFREAASMNPGGMSDAALGVVADLEQAFGRVTPVAMRGRVSKAVGMLIDASGIQAHVGELCELVTPGEPPLLAEVVGFRGNTAILTPLGPITGISALTEVVPTGRGHVCPVGANCWAACSMRWASPSTNSARSKTHTQLPVHREPVSPLARRMIDAPLATGIRAWMRCSRSARASASACSRRPAWARAPCWACSRAARPPR
jgi:hypothetical protein